LLTVLARAYLTRSPSGGFEARRGSLIAARADRPIPSKDHTTVAVELESSSGLIVHLSVKSPAERVDTTAPVILLLGGHKTGQRAVDLIPDTRGTIIAALSFPFDDDHEARGLAWLGQAVEIRRAARDTPPAILLALDYLLRDVAPSPPSIDLVGVSMGAPFACVAGALDERVTRVWSIHGGGNIRQLLDRQLEPSIPSRLPRRIVVEATRILVYGESLAPERRIGRLSPREFIMVNAADDEKIPRSSVETLFVSAGAPKRLIWMGEGHVRISRPDVVAALVDMVLDRATGTASHH
jgi:hypothetical protein